MKTVIAACLGLTLTMAIPAQVGVNKDLLNPNRAGEELLAALPHMTAELVATILDKRPFLGMDKLHVVLSKSLSEAQLTELYGKMFIPLNLNTAKREEILLVPGAGPRMAHEFDEYRPYKAMAQFRREIGKYVDKTELARLEQYVFIPLDMNTASEEDFKTIPGVGNRMVHEFMEYRPYKDIEQFRREIGKYVDEKEVARFERYIFVTKDS